MMHSKTTGNEAVATFVNTADGHGSQFEIHLKDGAMAIPPHILDGIKAEFKDGNTLYVDGIRIEGGNLIFSFCRGAILLAKVDTRWNPQRGDEKFHVIMREEMEDERNARRPQFTTRP